MPSLVRSVLYILVLVHLKQTVSNATLADATLVTFDLMFNLRFDGGYIPGQKKTLSLKRHGYSWHGNFCENTDPRHFLKFIFRRLLPILNIFSNFSSSALKRHRAKAAFDTLPIANNLTSER